MLVSIQRHNLATANQ